MTSICLVCELVGGKGREPSLPAHPAAMRQQHDKTAVDTPMTSARHRVLVIEDTRQHTRRTDMSTALPYLDSWTIGFSRLHVKPATLTANCLKLA